ncbi:acyl carrier protein [Mycobacterium sp. PDNC021]|uniref:acyl carrier protein n=1 Tax=Mycobacterium sp. PDNC021 TaxID=3391399 RepID=UPI003AAA891B
MPDTLPSTRDVIIDCLHDKLGTDPKSVKDTSTFDEIGADSIFLVEVSLRLERDLDIPVPEGTLESTQTIAEAIATIDSLRKAA